MPYQHIDTSIREFKRTGFGSLRNDQTSLTKIRSNLGYELGFVDCASLIDHEIRSFRNGLKEQFLKIARHSLILVTANTKTNDSDTLVFSSSERFDNARPVSSLFVGGATHGKATQADCLPLAEVESNQIDASSPRLSVPLRTETSRLEVKVTLVGSERKQTELGQSRIRIDDCELSVIETQPSRLESPRIRLSQLLKPGTNCSTALIAYVAQTKQPVSAENISELVFRTEQNL